MKTVLYKGYIHCVCDEDYEELIIILRQTPIRHKVKNFMSKASIGDPIEVMSYNLDKELAYEEGRNDELQWWQSADLQ